MESFWFAALFLCLIGGYYALTLVPWVERHVMFPVLEVSAQGASLLLNLAGAGTTQTGIVIQGPQFTVAVRRGCDPVESIVLFSAAVLAFPVPTRKKFSVLALGAAFLFALNLVRIVSLYFAGRARVSWFETLHQEWWPAMFIFAALLMWLAWLRRVKATAEPSDV